MSDVHQSRTFRDLPLDALVPPVLDARIGRDPEKLNELADDIRRRGLIMPIAVVPVGEKYEVVDGFRRYLACRNAGVEFVTCCIYPSKTVALEGVKYAANAFREDMSPAEEAVFFNELLSNECGGDIDRVCALVNKTRNFVDNRLELLHGGEDVFDALKDRKISIGVARELNKISDPHYRAHYLHHAIIGGATVTVVTAWVQEWRNLFENKTPLPHQTAAEPAPIVATGYDPHRCYICKKSDPRFIPEMVSIHTHCRLAILDAFLQQATDGNEPG